MKVWFAAFIPQSSRGGVQRSIKQFDQSLQKSGHQVEIIYASGKCYNNYLLFAALLAYRLMRNIFNPPDWIVARSSDSVFCAILVRLLHLKTRVALHNHGWEEKIYQIEKQLPGEIITNPTGWKARTLRFTLLRINLKLSEICICGTIEEARWISVKYRTLAKKMRIVPNGTETPDKPLWPLHKAYYPKFLLVGGFTWKKNLEYGLKIFERIMDKYENAQLILVGTGRIPDEKKTLLSSLGNSVLLVESELPEQMNRWYETCPFLISTSRYEGGRAFCILEAMARGCVVFASSIPSTREIIRDKKNGILLSGIDCEYDSSEILKICRDVQQIHNIGVAAWKYAKRNRIERQAKRLINVLSE